jgi:hypothetical protein
VHHKNGDTHDNRPENLELRHGNHGPGQRVSDKVSHAIEVLQKYPDLLRQLGFELVSTDPLAPRPSPHE